MELNPDKIFSLYENSVVKIISYGDQGVSQGSGVIIKEMNIIVTNFHVLNYNLALKISLKNKDIQYNSIFAFDPANDLLLIKLPESYSHLHNSFKLSHNIKVGEIVYTIGYPLGFEATISNGLLNGINSVQNENFSYLNNFNKNWIRFNAPISEGSSGGALVNSRGELIGLTTSTHTKGQNINFAIPISKVIKLYHEENNFCLPPQLKHHFLLYAIAFSVNNYFEALLHIDKCIKLSTDLLRYSFLSKKVHLLFLTGDYKRTKSLLQKLIPEIEKLGEFVEDKPDTTLKKLYFSNDLDILYYDIAEILFLEGSVQQSLSYVEKGLKIYKYSSELNYSKSKILFKMNDYENCLNYIDLAIDLDNGKGEYYSMRGKCYLELNNLDLAKISLEKAVKLFPNDHNSFRLLGSCYSKMGDYNKALSYFDESIEKIKQSAINPKEKNTLDFSILCSKAYCYMNLFKFEELKTIAQEVKNIKQKKYYGFYLESIAFSQLHDPDKALECINKSLELKKTHNGYSQRARIYMHYKNFDYAFADVTKALEIDNINIEYLLLRNKILSLLNRKTFDIDEFLVNDSSTKTNNFDKLISIGKNYKFNKDLPKAKKYFSLAAETKNLSLIEKVTLASCFSSIQDYKLAIHFISEVIQAKENKEDLLIVRMGYYFKVNQPNKVLHDLNKLINSDPENPDYYEYRWSIYLEMNLYLLAIQDLEKLIILQPGRQEELYALIKTIRKGPTYMKLINLRARFFKKSPVSKMRTLNKQSL